jgi:hypothetical protein
LESELDQLRSIDVIFQSSRAPRRYTFKHAFLQEAAYESMLRSKSVTRKASHCCEGQQPPVRFLDAGSDGPILDLKRNYLTIFTYSY